MNLLAKAEALIFRAAYDIYQDHLPLIPPKAVLDEILAMHPFTQAEILDRIELYVIEFSLDQSFFEPECVTRRESYGLLAALIDYETTRHELCPNLDDLIPPENFSFSPEIAALLPPQSFIK